MREYLAYSTQRIQGILPITDWQALSLEQHETLAAFRVRFSEFQEHLGKAMRAVAVEEEIEVERFGSVLAFMEKLGVLESTERWKLIRELQNAVNHEYEEDTGGLTQFLPNLREPLRSYSHATNDCLNFVPKRIGSGLNERD